MLEVFFYRLLGKSSTYKGNIRRMTSNHTCKDKNIKLVYNSNELNLHQYKISTYSSREMQVVHSVTLLTVFAFLVHSITSACVLSFVFVADKTLKSFADLIFCD